MSDSETQRASDLRAVITQGLPYEPSHYAWTRAMPRAPRKYVLICVHLWLTNNVANAR